MVDCEKQNQLVAVIGAGPAGLYAAQYLARHGVQVALFNRDIKPGGLAEYGIFPDKYKMRNGLLAQFKRILDMPAVRYLGNVTIGQSGDLQLDQLRSAGFQAFMITTGAQHHNWLGIPGENLAGVYHANEIVFHYNRLPEYAEHQLDFGQQVAVIGAGNVMLDIVNYLVCAEHDCRVTAYARRGPAQVKFDQQTLEPVAGCLDLSAIEAAVNAAGSAATDVRGAANAFLQMLTEARRRSLVCEAGLSFDMVFLRSPLRLLGDDSGRVKAITFEINQLVQDGDRILSRGTGVTETVPADTVIFSIGTQVDPAFGLPVIAGNYATTNKPRYPIDGISYEVHNPELCARCEDIFVSGWARLASEGIVGLARKDAERGARALLGFLETLKPGSGVTLDTALDRLPALNKRVVNRADLEVLWAVESGLAEKMGLPVFKFDANKAMLAAIETGSKS